MVNETDENYLLNVARKLYKSNGNINFLSKCQTYKILPKFTLIKPKIVETCRLSPDRILELRRDKINSCLFDEENRKIYNLNKFHSALNNLNLPEESCKELKEHIFSKAKTLELTRDNRRDRSFQNLIQYKINPEIAKITILNQTDCLIPGEIEDILCFGLNNSIGGRAKKLTLLSKFDGLFEHWEQYAISQNLSKFDILDVRSRCYLLFSEMSKCNTNTSHIKIVNTFLDQNNLILAPIDKSKNVCILTENNYNSKVKEAFSDPKKFKPILFDEGVLARDLENYKDEEDLILKNKKKVRIQINKLESFISKSEYKQIEPLESTKSAYGIIKAHKPNAPIRPIVSTVSSLCSGAERYILKILKPLEDMCNFTVNSTKNFKKFFLETRDSFNFETHEIISIDAQKLYTSVNSKLVITEIIKAVYNSPHNFFNLDPNEETNFGTKTQIPTRTVFRNFLYQILLQFNIFSTVAGHYQQIDGLSMGSKISPLIANFYVNIMEQRIIKKEIKNGNIVAYCRYVDDVYCIIRKDHKNRILKLINDFDVNFLAFTHENMVDNSLPFLDTEIYLNPQNMPEIRKFIKPTASEVIVNFKSILPKKYKLSTLKGDIFRCHYTCSTVENRDIALQNLSELYVKNEYPRRMVEKTILEIRNKNFESNGNHQKFQDLRKNSPNRFYTLSLPYTSHRCAKVASKLTRLLKTHTPNYHINIAWRSEKLQKYFSHKLKLPVPDFAKIGTTYKYDCLCQDAYIGESKRSLRTRIKEHNQKCRKTAISEHIYGSNQKPACPEYNSEIFKKYGDKPSSNQRIDFLQNRFKILQKNLTKTRDRKIFEAVAITMENPKLNAQILHRKVSII